MFDEYIVPGTKVLFIGDGSSVFVDKYRSQFVDTCGVEDIEHPFIYKKKLTDIHFPTDNFDCIVCLNSDESIFKEIYRILKPIDNNGRVIWHIQANDTIVNQLLLADFIIEKSINIIGNKLIIHARKPVQKRVKILFPPGIGDVYWSLVKIQALIEQHSLGIPDIYIMGSIDKQWNGHARAFQFLEMQPFIHVTRDTIPARFVDEQGKLWGDDFWSGILHRNDTGIFNDVAGCDYFIVYNGAINTGKSLEEIDSVYPCNWDLPMFISKNQDNFKRRMGKKYGEYILFHFGCQGTYTHWMEQFPIDKIINFINTMSEKTGMMPILIGGAWDTRDPGLGHILDHTNCEDMLGRTSVEELFGLIRGSKAVMGFPSGLSMISPALGTKTLSLWSDLYPEETSWNVVNPELRNKLYFTEKTKDLTVDYLLAKAMQILTER